MNKATPCILVVLFAFSQMAFAAGTDDFVITVKTDITDPLDTEFTVPAAFSPGRSYDFDVDCGDGSAIHTGLSGAFPCSYASAGEYTIRIYAGASGRGYPKFQPSSGNEKEKVISLVQWGTGVWYSMEGAFSQAKNMLAPATDVPNLSEVTSLNFMFSNATLANPDTSAWDTSNIIRMKSMFSGAAAAMPVTTRNGDIWNTSNVLIMESLFRNATNADPDVKDWDTSAVTNMKRMFNGASGASPDTRFWDTSEVTDMSYMFGSTFGYDPVQTLPDITNWDISKVITMQGMFSGPLPLFYI